MKKILFFVSVLAFINCKAQQIPWTGIESGTLNNVTGTLLAPFELYAPISTPGPVIVSGQSQVDFIAGDRVHLQPGFSAHNLTGNGYFHAQIGVAPDFDVVFIQPNEHIPNVGQFEKLEMGLTLPANVEQQINAFIQNPANGINPFDPDQISIEAQFNRGTTSYAVYGFYYEEFSRDPSAMTPFAPAIYLPISTNYHWRIRFAPPILGTWNCSIAIRINNASTYAYQVNNITFNCVPSSNKGFLKKGNDDWHLAYNGSQSSFFALGENIAWSDDQYFRGGPSPQWPNFPRLVNGGILDDLDWISNLSDNGGNMTRIVSAPWSYELEWEHLGNYEGRMNRAWEQDQLFDLCEQKNMKLFYCLELHTKYADMDPFNSATRDGWDMNPYHTEISGVDNPDDFLINPTAKRKFKNKLRYFISRWGYSTSLGVFELLSEMDLWKYRDPEHHFDELANNPLFQTDQRFWHDEMLSYVKSLLSYRPMLTSSCYGPGSGRDFNITPFDSPFLDITTNHAYKVERNANKIRLDEFNQIIVNRGTHSLWPTKPTVFDEMGIYHLGGDPYDDGDKEGCNDVNYHNELWATSFMGGIGTGFNWWQWFNNEFRHDNYPALKAFFNGIDFQNTTFKDPDFWDDDSPFSEPPHFLSKVETFYIRDQHAHRVMGWVHNATNWWGNLDQNCPDRNNNFPQLPIDNDPYPFPISIPLHTKYEIHGLDLLQDYTLELYLTRSNGGLYQTSTWQSNIFGTLKPDYEVGLPDWAFKAYRSGYNFRKNNEITYDTLLCSEDTIYTQGHYENDTLGNFNYHWDFGNGQTSNEKNTFAIFSTPGTYLVTLVVSDSLGWSDTLQQYIVKPPLCNSSSRIALPVSQENNSSWNAFPNPASNNLTLTFDSSWSSNIEVNIFSLDGRCVIIQSVPLSSDREVPLAQLPSGVYLLRVKDENHIAVKRIIIER